MERIFDPWQREAIEISGGRHLVLAPPGCGKTDILAERIVHAHEAGVEYGDMLCLTFTNRAAKSMALRIADRTANPVPDDLYVGNIHRFCSQMLFNSGLVNHNSAIIDEGDVENIIQEELCRQLNLSCRTTELMRFQHAMRQLVLGMRGDLVLHNELFRTGAMTKLCDVLGRPCDEEGIAAVYSDIDLLVQRHSVLREMPAANQMLLAKAYERYKEDYDLLDYDDLLILAYQHLASPASPPTPLRTERGVDTTGIPLPSPQGEGQGVRLYRWIEIDEVQDLNALQFAIVDLLATPDATIVYLGDEQQAIFSFIGAKLETLQTLKRRCNGHIHRLHTNYRSPKYLLDLQNDYSLRNLGSCQQVAGGGEQVAGGGEPVASGDSPLPAKEDLCLLNVGDARLESYYAARFAKRYGDMSPDGRVAILVGTNREADEVSEVMNGMGISHFKISGTDLFSLPTMRLLTAHLTVLADETVFIAWARLLWGLGVTPTYTAARTLMRDMRRLALLPSDFLLHPQSSWLQEFVRLYDSEEIVIFDTETTGLDVYNDDIIQIAAVRVRRGKVVGEPFNIILETGREIPALVGGHPNPMCEVYRTSRRHPRAEGLRKFMDYCRGKALVGHNVAFDYQILKHNLRKEKLDTQLLALDATRCFDTLKYIRLVRPRLRQYKLGHLLEVLHLEGQNSHQADDDILATLSLLNYCHACALPLVARQQLFVSDRRSLIDRFCERYAEIYRHGTQDARRHSLVDELQYVYARFLAARLVDPVEKWRHLIHYIETDLVRTDRYPTFEQQLARYVTDLNTCKEADLCSNSLEERYIISTVHKAKGLEFDTVIVYRAVDGNYPGTRSWTEKQLQEDARRLFVALSRSRHRLCITYDDHLGNSLHALSPFLEKVKGHFTLYRRGPDGKIREV